MAFPPPFLTSILLLLLVLCRIASATKYSLPLIKDATKTQLYTSILVGTPPVPVNLTVDLASKYTWFTCNSIGYNNSSTYVNIPCDAYCLGCLHCDGPATPSCNNESCGAVAYSPWSNFLYPTGLISDTVSLSSAPLPDFQFTCATSNGPLKGLSRHTKGVITLARTTISVNEQVSSTLKVPRKFALCAPSSSAPVGAVYFGGGPYKADLSKSLVTTALVTNPHSTSPFFNYGEASIEYFVNVTSIKIGGSALNFNDSLLSFDGDGNGGAKISTTDAYTTLHSQIYRPFVDLFVAKAAAFGLVKVAAVGPFGACFSSKSIRYNAMTGKGIPIVELVFNERNATWRIYGSNSMVTVSKGVQCLGFVDGGDAMTPIVIGAKQLEDNLDEFDLEANKLGFSSSLLLSGTSCSQV